MAQPSPAAAAMAATTPGVPAWRRAMAAIPTMAAMLTSATPTASPACAPPTLTGIASASKKSGPGLLTSNPIETDTDVHEPSNGWCSVNTSAARMAK
jgi:hypothetical protein